MALKPWGQKCQLRWHLGHCKLQRNALGPAREMDGCLLWGGQGVAPFISPSPGRDGRGLLFTPVIPKAPCQEVKQC